MWTRDYWEGTIIGSFPFSGIWEWG